MDCKHINQVAEWGWADENFGPSLWKCGWCGLESKERFYEYEEEAVDHTKCGGPKKCFACKARTLSVSTGDANSKMLMPQKKWDAELNAYKSAIDQGIEPATTNMADITAAVALSDAAGKAFDSTTKSFKD